MEQLKETTETIYSIPNSRLGLIAYIRSAHLFIKRICQSMFCSVVLALSFLLADAVVVYSIFL